MRKSIFLVGTKCNNRVLLRFGIYRWNRLHNLLVMSCYIHPRTVEYCYCYLYNHPLWFQQHTICNSLSLLHLGICLLHSPCTPVSHLQHICTNGIETKFGREISVSIRRIQTYSAASCYSGGITYSHCRFHSDRGSTRPRPRGWRSGPVRKAYTAFGARRPEAREHAW